MYKDFMDIPFGRNNPFLNGLFTAAVVGFCAYLIF